MTDIDDQKQLYVKCSDPNVVCDSKPTVSMTLKLIHIFTTTINHLCSEIRTVMPRSYAIVLRIYFSIVKYEI